MNPNTRHLSRTAKLLFAGTVLGIAAGCAAPTTEAPAAAAPAATVWSFQTQSTDLVPGVYQSAYSTPSQRLYISSAVGRPPVRASRLVKLNPATRHIEATVTPALQASRQDGQVQALYGIAVDDAHAHIWATNTRSGSVAVYRQADLTLVKQFADNSVPHARDVVIDATHSRAYVSSPASNVIHVFDTATLQARPGIPLTGAGAAPKLMSLALDIAHQRLYAVSLNTAEVFAIDTATGRQAARYTIPGAQGASGMAMDSQTQQLYVAAQKSGNLTVLDARSGQILHQVSTGAGALNVAFDPLHRLAYVANRGAGTVSVLNDAGVIQAQIPTGAAPNHVTIDPQGTAWALIKKSKNDPNGDRLVRIEPSR